MDSIPLYDKKRAGEELERQVGLRSQGFQTIRSAANMTEVYDILIESYGQLTSTKDKDWVMNYRCLKHGPVWNFVTMAQEEVMEEVVVSFQGVIYKKDIAPFNPKSFYEKPNMARFLRQSLTLCGLQTPSFQKVADSVLQIHALLARSVGYDDMEDCSMVSKAEDGDTLLHMSNRYLTPQKEAVGGTKLPIPASIDPNGYLNRVAGHNFVYTDENQVRYFERRRFPGTEDTRLEECNPIIFRIGDIVEAQVTFIIITTREGRKKTSMVLRSWLLLDGTITHNSIVAQMLNSKRDDGPKVNRPLKRRVGYEEEETLKMENENESDQAIKPPPTFRRKYGYMDERVVETANRLSDMDIDAGPSRNNDSNIGPSNGRDLD